MGPLPYRRTSTRDLRGATLALLCALGVLLSPAAAVAQTPTTGPKAPPAATATTEPDATDAVTTPSDGADGGAAAPPAGGTTPAVGAATPDVGAVDPAAPAGDPAAVDPAATPPAQTTTAPAGSEAAPTTGVVVQEPDDSLPGWVWAAVAIGIVAAALVAWLLVLASGRIERLAPVGHALGEAGWRLSNRWAEFMDWLRFGSGR